MVKFSENILLAPESEQVCYCLNITKGQIQHAIAGGADTLAKIKGATGACLAARCKEMNPRGR
ncbi:(2Fe-2S)-binding protein [Maridesulfovibrio frigidus]|uniref:(2Fe-2S)-binding protein n=1 Tax=Maridesulfovibrio frigidus TaxID=340956 RepID=UPI000550736D|nr:(2Fe-2S)-binding protein [Maridesulfovibrio frigidus]